MIQFERAIERDTVNNLDHYDVHLENDCTLMEFLTDISNTDPRIYGAVNVYQNGQFKHTIAYGDQHTAVNTNLEIIRNEIKSVAATSRSDYFDGRVDFSVELIEEEVRQ